MHSYYHWEGKPHRLKARDSQRAKLYAAERCAFGEEWTEKIEDGDLAATVRYVRQVEASATWRKILAKSGLNPLADGLEIADGRGCRAARGSRARLTLPVWARTRPVILHEMAHAATGDRAKHNWPFAAAYLLLVGTFMGSEARDRLKEEFRKARVRYTPPRTFTAEHWVKLRERGQALAAAARAKSEARDGAG